MWKLTQQPARVCPRQVERLFSTQGPVQFRVVYDSDLKRKQDISLLREADTKFPLPGTTAPVNHFFRTTEEAAKAQQKPKPIQNDVLSTTLNHQRQLEVLANFVGTKKLMDTDVDVIPVDVSYPLRNGNEGVECTLHECPDLVRKEFADLFPKMDVRKHRLTAIVLTQKSENDMSAWSSEMEVEREELMMNFISSAESICNAIKGSGHWADFIDPSSGRPYLGPFTNATLFETDDRYRHFGFQIEDLGCCKVIWHRLWGKNAFAGVLFTSLPPESDILADVIPKKYAQ